MTLNDLYCPTKRDRSLIASGERKRRLRRLIDEDKIILDRCPICQKSVWQYRIGRRRLTRTGSIHYCHRRTI